MNVGDALKEARGDMPRKDVANALGISLAALSLYESGERVPRDDVKVKMASLYKTTVGRLFFGE